MCSLTAVSCERVHSGLCDNVCAFRLGHAKVQRSMALDDAGDEFLDESDGEADIDGHSAAAEQTQDCTAPFHTRAQHGVEQLTLNCCVSSFDVVCNKLVLRVVLLQLLSIAAAQPQTHGHCRCRCLLLNAAQCSWRG